MQPHHPSIPLANAALPAAMAPPYRITRRRCLASVALGLSAALFFSPIGVGPWWWQPVVAAVVLVGAALLNATRIRHAGSGLSIGWVLRSPVATGIVTGVLGIAAIMLARLSSMSRSGEYTSMASFGWALLEGIVVAVLVGLVSALVAQSQPSTPLAVLGAILGWGAATGANLAALILGTQAATTAGVIYTVIFFLLYGGFAGLPLALLGGLLGRGLRALA
jgi:hypothetical protein